MKLFIIDDEEMIREMLKDFISEKFPGYEVSVFVTGEAALQHIYVKPDLIILDYFLNSKDSTAKNGVEILKQIKNVMPDVPVIFLSGQESPVIAVDIIKYGAYDYVIKNENAPHRIEILLGKILGHKTLNAKLNFQRIMNIVLTILVIALIVGIAMMRVSS